MYAFTGHLRIQQKLINDMKSTCPKLATRWTAMGNVCKWLLEKRTQLFQHIQEKQPKDAPPMWWWVIASTVSALSQHVNITVTKLQAQNLLVSQQTEILQHLASAIATDIGVQGPFDKAYLATIDQSQNSIYGRYLVNFDTVDQYINDQGIFIQDTFRSIPFPLRHQLLNNVGIYFARVVDGIFNVQAARTSSNGPQNPYTIPPILPHQLVKLRPSEFTTIVVKHLRQLEHLWELDKITMLETQFRDLRVTYQHNDVFAKAINACNNNTSLEKACAVIEGEFDVLMDFAVELLQFFLIPPLWNQISQFWAGRKMNTESL